MNFVLQIEIMDLSEEDLLEGISEICENFKWEIKPKKFQLDFFCKAVKGLSGFLEVN